MKKHLVSFLFMLCAISLAQAQISRGGAPLFNHSKASVPTITLPALDNSRYLQEDIDMVPGSSPLRIGIMQSLSLSNSDTGAITILSDGTRVWRVAICSPKACFTSLRFSTFDIPQGARLFLYDATGNFVLGSFTAQNRLPDGTFHTQAIPGEVCCLEYQEPANTAKRGTLVLSQVCHGYKEALGCRNNAKDHLGYATETCHINVACPDADDWRDQVRSVCEIYISTKRAGYLCSGALVNTTANDKTPYVLSANHCQDISNDTITGFTFYFNYQSPTCTGNDGPINQTVAGAEMVAQSASSDFLLLRLYEAVPDSYGPFYAGWDRQVIDKPTIGSNIHHPGGDLKKISFPWLVQIATTPYRNYFDVEWYGDRGMIEHGSSGSPLFNAEHLIIGQLYGTLGELTCANPNGVSLYGRIASSWIGGGSASTRLSDWLDPLHTNIKTLQGINYDYAVTSPGGTREAEVLKVFPNPSTGMVRVEVDDIGSATYKIYDLQGRMLYEGSTILAITTHTLNLTFLPAGSYTIELYVGNKKYSNTLVIYK